MVKRKLHLNCELHLNLKFICSKKIVRIYMITSLLQFWIFCKKGSFENVVVTFSTKVHLKGYAITQILLMLSLYILYKSHLTNLNKKIAIKYGNSVYRLNFDFECDIRDKKKNYAFYQGFAVSYTLTIIPCSMYTGFCL